MLVNFMSSCSDGFRNIDEKDFNRLVVGGVTITETDGYFVFCAQKRAARYANK